ncbi:hypothetical protein JL720_5535 [Aureococcus anophagefferens]|nr:hypothetical protein JL720_5535 [Aureococcus anophagefferens]
MESIAHRRASTHQRRPTEVLLHGSDAPACDRLRALRKAAVVDGLDGAARPVAWKLLLGVGRCDAKRYGALRELRRRAAAAAAAAALARRRGDRAEPSPIAGVLLHALPSELEAFWCLEALVAAKAPTYFTPNLGAPRRARASWTGASRSSTELWRLTPPPPSPRLGTRRRASSSGSSHGAALLGAESSPASRRGAAEDLFASLCSLALRRAPPLAEVVVLWDALLALGVHSGVLLCAALCVSLRDELLLDPDPLARLQPRNLPPLDGRRLVAGAARLAPKIPPPLFDLVLRHPVDVVDRAAILARGDGDPGKPPPPPKPRRSSLIM